MLIILFSVLTAIGCSGGANSPNPKVNPSPTNTGKSGPLPVSGYEIVHTFAHDPRAFTQGLFYHNGFFYESTGEEGRSSLRKVEIDTGKVVQKFDLPREDFGEGIAHLNGKIYMLTWRQGLGRVFDVNDFKLLKEFSYQGEGWGITTDGTNLFMSQGTHVLKMLDPETLKTIKTIPVIRDDGRPQMQINELEFVKGELWANIWHSEDPDVLGKPNHIARIDPASGRILGWVDLAGISPDDQNDERKHENTLNGIAYDAASDRIFVTGKQWKHLYEIKLKPKQS